MKTLKLILAAIALFAFVGCSTNPVSTSNESLSFSPKLAAGDPAVALFFVKGKSYNATWRIDQYVEGSVEVEKYTGTRTVKIHYTTGNGIWKDADAVYSSDLGNNRERWIFAVKVAEAGYSNGQPIAANVQFAVKYTVNGVTYWDNNAGQDYKVSSPGVLNLYPTERLAKSALILTRAQTAAVSGGTSFTGTLILKNIAYSKVVTIVYTTDNWVTTKTLPASYNSSTGFNQEYWTWSATVSSSAQIKFAISYLVNGITYWDNNFTQNYTLSVPGLIN